MAYENKFGVPKGSIQHKEMTKERNMKMYAMFLKGHSYADIAKEFNMSLAACRIIIPKMIDQKSENNAVMLSRELTVQLNRLDTLYVQAHNQWEKSCEVALEVEKTDDGFAVADDATGMKVGSFPSGKDKGVPAKRSVTTKHKQRVGDVRFLTEMRAILDTRRKILGLDDSEVKNLVVNFIRNDTTIVQQNPNVIELETSEFKEMAEIMRTLNIGPGGVPLAIAAPVKEDDDEDDAIDADFSDGSSATVASEIDPGEPGEDHE